MLKRLLTVLGKLLLLPVVLVLLPFYLLLRKLGWVSGATSNLTGLQDLSGLTLFQQLLNQANSAEARYLQYGDLTGLDDSITVWERILQHPDFAKVIEDFRLGMLGDSARVYVRRYQVRGEVADLNRALSQLQQAVSLTPDISPFKSDFLSDFGNGLRARYVRTGEVRDLEKAIQYHRQAVSLSPTNSPQKPGYLNNLGNDLRARYARTGEVRDLDEAIECYQQAVSLTPKNSYNLPIPLNNLGTGLADRYARTGAMSDLNKAIQCFQQAVFLTPAASPAKPNRLTNLGNGLRNRYTRRGKMSDLEEAIKCCQQAVDLTSDISLNKSAYLNNLGNDLRARYVSTGKMSDLEEAIKCYQKAVVLTLADSPELPGHFNNLGTGLRNRYAITGAMSDLDAAIQRFQQAVDLTFKDSPNKPIYLDNLGTGLLYRYAHTGAVRDLEEAIKCFQQAMKSTLDSSPNKPYILFSLGAGLTDRYARTGVMSDLEEAIKCFQQAMNSPTANSLDKLGYLNSLGAGLIDHYNRTCAMGDLDTAIQHFQQSVDLTSDASPNKPGYLHSLGIGLRTRYSRTGAMLDLDEAIRYFQQSVDLTSDASPNKSTCLNSLGNGLTDRYARTGAVCDLEAGIQCFQQAVSLTPTNSPNFPTLRNNQGTGLTDRYARTGAVDDLDEAIQCFRQVVSLTPKDSPSFPTVLNNLGHSLADRYARTGAISDLDEAIKHLQQSMSLPHSNSSDWPRNLTNLGNSLIARYALTGSMSDLEEAIKCYRRAAQRGLEVAPEHSLTSARNWLLWASTRQSWQEVTQAHSYTYQAGQRLLKSQLLRAHKESWLKDMQGLASQAAYAFTKLNQLEKAVVALERGLARLLSEALQRDRANLEQLKTTGHADLYDRYQDIIGRYHWAQQQQDVNALKTVQADLDNTIEDIRQVPGYEDFLKPVEFELIQAAAQEKPLVYILTTSAGGLALIVRKEEITPVWLPNLEDTFAGYWEAYIQWRNTPTDQNLRHHWHTTIETTTQQLWTTVMQPLIDALPPHTHHLTLIPVGRLNLLPWHAAWTEDDATGRCYALDKLTIAYAPNAVTVTQCQQWAKLTTVPKLLAVSEPHPQPPTAGSLHYSRYATPAICSLFPDNTQQLARTQATVATVTAQLREAHTLWYFYCHGLTNFEEPLKSGLLLAGSQEQFLTLGDVLNLKVTGVRLATLAACETNIPNLNKLPDEVVSLAAGLLQAGVAGVIASLWSVDAVSTAFLMVRCYDILHQRWQTDGNMQAPLVFALQEAQRWLRDSTKRELQEWIDQRQLRQHLDLVQQTELDDLWYDKAEEDRPFAAPYYWAAFVAMGC